VFHALFLRRRLAHNLTNKQDFTFGLTVDDEEDGIMGTIVVPENSEGSVDDGDLLCILLHRAEPEAVEKESGGGESKE